MENVSHPTVSADSSSSANQVLTWLEKDLAIVRLGSPEERVVLLNESRMNSLALTVQNLRAQPDLRGVVFIGANDRLFSAGADINVIRSVTNPEVGRQLAKKGQEIFNAIEQLPCVTVAAISGACVGGACELALACKYRIATDLPQTRIGLPEVKLGILPGFGGTQRLPRLIGVRRALDVMLKGQLLSSERAYALGLIDALVSPAKPGDIAGAFEELEAMAIAVALGKKTLHRRKLSLVDTILTRSAPGRRIVSSRVRRGVEKETAGKYPAPPKIVDMVFAGLTQGMTAGLELEAKAIGELIVTPESKALVHLFFLSEEASKLGRTAKINPSELQVSVIGAGTMGAGIAGAFLGTGSKVVLFDTIETARIRARESIEATLVKRRSFSLARREQLLRNLTLATSLDEIKGSTLVIEAVVEDLKLKRELLKTLSGLIDERAILASNTSSLSITDIAKEIPHPERIIGMHFFNPVAKMPLVELIQGKETNDRTIVHAAAFISGLGKYPIVVKDVPGFLVNRILSPYLIEASHLLSEGVRLEEIDRAALAFGMPMGPFRLLDEVGLDVAAKVADTMAAQYGTRMKGPNFAAKLLEVGRLGRKSGKGFYRYQDGKHESDPDVVALLPIKTGMLPSSIGSDVILDRLLLAMVNEAVRCFDDGVAGMPGEEAGGQIDLASVMGLGFPPYHGGILRYADQRGAQTVFRRLSELERQCGERLTPAPGLRVRGERDVSFYDAI